MCRLYREMSLKVRNKTPKPPVKTKLREDRQKARRPNDIGAMIFVHDQTSTAKKIHVLTIADTF
tara:strand:- start:227 stop:418 length:192 start_codon:yes stop_codon:yes gene_type:complete